MWTRLKRPIGAELSQKPRLLSRKPIGLYLRQWRVPKFTDDGNSHVIAIYAAMLVQRISRVKAIMTATLTTLSVNSIKDSAKEKGQSLRITILRVTH